MKHPLTPQSGQNDKFPLWPHHSNFHLVYSCQFGFNAALCHNNWNIEKARPLSGYDNEYDRNTKFTNNLTLMQKTTDGNDRHTA